MKKLHDICTVEGCGRKHKARGYCQTHYMAFKRGVENLGPIKTRVRDKPEHCVEAGCMDPVKAKGLCATHYQRLLRHGYVKNPDRTKPFTDCRIEGCGNRMYANSLCHNHYTKDRLWKKRGLSVDGYLAMLKRQNSVCAICKQQETAPHGLSGKTKDMAIDHCHETGKIRGLLCSSCNRGLGLFGDNVGTLRRAIEYLDSHAAEPR
jgi:hypothetical protein